MTGLRRLHLPAIFIAAAVSALLVIVGTRDAAAVMTFNPYASVCLDDTSTAKECDGNTAAGAPTDIRTNFGVNAPDSNFGGVITFIPPDWFVPQSGDIPIGAIAGQLTAKATLGLINQPCANGIFPSFTLMNASVNINNTIDPRPPGESDVFTPLAKDANGNGIPDGVDKYPSFLNETFDIGAGPMQPRARLMGITLIEGNWIPLQFLVFEPGTRVTDELPASDFPPERGYPSVTVLNNPEAPPAQSAITDFCSPLDSINITFGLTRDNPCTPVPADPSGANCPQADDKAEAYPKLPCDNKINDDAGDDTKVNDGCPQVNAISESGTQCNNATSDDGEDAAINDGCPPVGSLSEGGLIPDPDGCDTDNDEASCEYRKNPGAPGSYPYTVLAASQRDADGDGHENSLDVCTFDPEPGANYRSGDPTFDADIDGLTAACDPNPNVPSNPTPQTCPEGYTGHDEDQDCFSNRQDNCPLVDNDQNDEDNDGIGDDCDPNPFDADAQGEFIKVVLDGIGPQAITAAPPGGPTPTPPPSDGDGGPTPTPTPPPTAADEDGDGVSDADDQCPGTAAGASVDASGCSEAQLEEKKEEKRQELLEGATAGMNLAVVLDTVVVGGSTDVLAVCADQNDDPIPGVDITFEIVSQPGSDADLEGQAEVTKTSDAEGVAEAKLNVGNTPGKIVVSASAAAEGCEEGTIEVTVTGASDDDTTTTTDGSGADGAADTGVGSLAPVAASIPAWAAIASSLGGAGLLGSLGVLAARIFGVRQRGRH